MDIEGTTSAARYVYDVLFPYARERMADWISGHGDDPATAEAVRDVADTLGVPSTDTAAIVGQLHAWIDDDVKSPPLKTLQGLIWADGYARGDLTSHVFDDVVPALRSWREGGIALAVYSSGSVAAQRALLSHTPQGDLTPMLTDYFDLTTAGRKQDPDSYRAIAARLATAPGDVLFLSDIQAELDAAREAGWQAVGLTRPGEAQATAHDGPVVASFADLVVTCT